MAQIPLWNVFHLTFRKSSGIFSGLIPTSVLHGVFLILSTSISEDDIFPTPLLIKFFDLWASIKENV
jgi:hypothetical protein